jgi:DnaJ-class molecular chaperone
MDTEKNTPTEPETQDIFSGLGMPNYMKPDERGNFPVKYTVRYPQTLKKYQKVKIF